MLCPLCEASVEVSEDLRDGDVVECEECGASLVKNGEVLESFVDEDDEYEEEDDEYEEDEEDEESPDD